eukprot:Seg253.4 transcript_id=Seg253.4/GoldUCD/mRNA.D3Y31 product="hypothetical protein" protein_id=Seg253.4/GoldUCD/D3Y31
MAEYGSKLDTIEFWKDGRQVVPSPIYSPQLPINCHLGNFPPYPPSHQQGHSNASSCLQFSQAIPMPNVTSKSISGHPVRRYSLHRWSLQILISSGLNSKPDLIWMKKFLLRSTNVCQQF